MSTASLDTGNLFIRRAKLVVKEKIDGLLINTFLIEINVFLKLFELKLNKTYWKLRNIIIHNAESG